MEEERDPGAGVRPSTVPTDGVAAHGSKTTAHDAYVERHPHISGRGLISASALGLADGLVTNLAFLTGFGGAVSGDALIRFAGLAAMLAGTVSMFFGGILSARSEHDLFRADSNREAYEMEYETEEEKSEMKWIYMDKGLTEQESDMVVARLLTDKKKFLEDMLTNELHVHEHNLQNPYKLGAVIGLSFLVGSFVPLAPYYVFTVKSSAVAASVAVSLIFLFAAGEWKGRIVKRKPLRSGLETLLIGAVAAGILFVIGSAFAFV
ncbi:MAG TPA: VIT1/CCC1 transporter family protein [Nitrososphaerales archaeon]|nr:VIT1/CCC1 transporter family protein [Nitrososphaerales archaeon]